MQLLFSAALGLGAGVLSGLFGIGGGLIIVPGLILLAGFTQPMAAGTSLAALLAPVGALGAYQYWREGQIAVWPAVLIAVGLLLGAYVGARIGLSLPADAVQRAFGVLLVLVGIRLALFG
ncbi:MAG TPA: TSUP family transporter [Candidatus Limnocylindria bacterium]